MHIQNNCIHITYYYKIHAWMRKHTHVQSTVYACVWHCLEDSIAYITVLMIIYYETNGNLSASVCLSLYLLSPPPLTILILKITDTIQKSFSFSLTLSVSPPPYHSSVSHSFNKNLYLHSLIYRLMLMLWFFSFFLIFFNCSNHFLLASMSWSRWFHAAL